ncbi:hypothetical protein SAMN02745163_01570 [Clostridium cavendishii DSM 21758]|uniref:Uncharacterized protein n=1 Tax=Clostridium cavendishii DSM 21758 TaxID=1121302 RepID=A0A1M6HT20_9CLOT|nr:hypothetical protein [Clostridium cavendishii]SHJ25341.1 hypothetical protein SAMN02745163_01570 [Clostridium cavendishii DSM 21758]
MKFLTNLDLNKNELQNARIQNLAAPPNNPLSGQAYYNTKDNIAYIFDGTTWRNLFSMSIEEVITLLNKSNYKIDDDNLSNNVNDAVIKRHEHINASILNVITQELINKWNLAEVNAKSYADKQINDYKIRPATKNTLGGIKVGANLSINEDGTLNANDNSVNYIVKQEKFVASEGQTLFSLTKGSYKVGLGALSIFMYGAKISNDAFNETTEKSFTMKNPLNVGDIVLAEYIELVNVTPYPIHGKEHLSGGVDPIPKATTYTEGLMSKEDKNKLDSISIGANKVIRSDKNGMILIDGLEQNVYIHPNDINTRHVTDDEKNVWNAKETTLGSQDKANRAETNAEAYTDNKATDILSNANKYTDNKVAALVNSAPEALDTLQELAKALGNDPNFSSTILNKLGLKLEKVAFTIGDGKTTEFTLKHNLNTSDTTWSIREASTGEGIFTDVITVDTNAIKVLFAQAPAKEQFRVVVNG